MPEITYFRLIVLTETPSLKKQLAPAVGKFLSSIWSQVLLSVGGSKPLNM